MKSNFLDAMRQATKMTRGQSLTDATRHILRTLSGKGGEPESASETAEQAAQPSQDAAPQFPLTPPHLRPTQPLGETLKLMRDFQMPDLNGGLTLPDTITLPGAKRPAVETPEGATFVTRQYKGAEGERAYKVYTPSRVEPNPALIVMLHGCTQNADDFAVGTGMNILAEEHGFIVVYPEQTMRANHMGCWNWFNPADQRRDQGEAGIIAGITRAVIQDYGVDADRVFVAGLSAGGAMAEVMSVNYPDLYNAAGVHSGLVFGSASDTASAFAAMSGRSNGRARRPGAHERVRTIVFHGDSDSKVHPVNAELIVAEARAGLSAPVRETKERGAVNGRAYTRTRAYDSNSVAQVELWEIDGLGHAWSGGSPRGSHADPQGPDASREMVRFFMNASALNEADRSRASAAL